MTTQPSRAGLALRIGIIGAGRVGATLGAAWRTAGHTVTAVAAESDASRGRAKVMLPGVEIGKPTAVARSADIVLLAVPDDALDNVVRMLTGAEAIGPGQTVVHTSGRHGLAVLAPAIDAGAAGIALHPAMTFTGTSLDLPHLRGLQVGVTCAETVRPLARELVDGLGGALVPVEESARALYHSSLVHGSNYLITLVTQAMDMLRLAGSPDPAATLRPLLLAALDNALDLGGAALTGPIVRGDIETVQRHLEALAQSAPQSLETYVAMGRATVNEAVSTGRLELRRAAALIATLNDALERLAV